MSVLDQALADMRAGQNVALIASTGRTLDRIHDQSRKLLRDGERIGRRMISNGTGSVTLSLYASSPSALRGLEVDRAYFDHSDIHAVLAPTMCTSTAPGPRFVHGPE
ncbi:hypothetical protein [Nocardia sp. NPDC055049]